MKKCLFIALAALGFVACEKDNENSGSNLSGELEQSYVAITLAASDLSTRAVGDPYEIGRDEERAVKSAYVFFFKDGAAFPVTFNESTSTSSNAGQSNYLRLNLPLPDDGTDMPNISDVKDAVLVLQNYKGEYPNQIVAVLNWDPTGKSSYTLSELKTKMSTFGDDTKGYVMSNAVYYAENAKKTIDAVDLTIDNICKSAGDALNNPVTIHVERVAAKVVFTADNAGKFHVGEVNGQPVYAQITGFELFNDATESWLIKKIDPTTWTNEDLGFVWNESPWFRSYWAQSIGKSDIFGNENDFDWENDNKLFNEFVYCGENTLTWTTDNDVRTKVIVKAQLVNTAGDEIELVNWYGKDYVGEEKLKTVVANTIYNTYFYSTDGGTNYIGLKPEDIQCVARNVTDPNAYEVYFQLSTEDGKGVNRTWYKYEGGEYKKYDDNTILDAELATIQPALIYKHGMTYYYTDIKHLGAEDKTGEFGVVRNHIYKVNISAIKGYGTPIYNGATDFITPETPQDVTTYVSAQINILSWRLVDYDYPLGN